MQAVDRGIARRRAQVLFVQNIAGVGHLVLLVVAIGSSRPSMDRDV
jgi:hypothetical protein